MSIFEYDEEKHMRTLIEEGREKENLRLMALFKKNLQECYELGIISEEALRKIQDKVMPSSVPQ